MARHFIKCAIVLFILASMGAHAQIISTYAGTGIAGYSGDGAQATNAQMHSPFGLAVDDDGNLFIAEKINNIIRKISSSGIVTTYAGTGVAGFSGDGGPATNAQLSEPWGIALDKQGNLYLTDHANKRIRKIDPSGIITSVAGGGRFSWPHEVPATAIEMNNPKGITVDSQGRVYYTDADIVCRIDADDTVWTIAGTGRASYTGDGGPAIAARLNGPTGIAIDAAGNMYIGDEGNNVVRKVNAAGIISTYAGNGASGGFYGDGGSALSAGFFGPFNITLDKAGNLYIQDIYNRRIRKVNKAGIITTVAGNGIAAYAGDGGPATAASFYYGTGFAIDRRGDYFIADLWYSVIRKVTMDHTGVDETNIRQSNIQLFPNPNKGVFTITGTFNENTTIEITNMLGQVVYKNDANTISGLSVIPVDLGNYLPDGVYLLHTNSGNNRETLKFVIKY